MDERAKIRNQRNPHALNSVAWSLGGSALLPNADIPDQCDIHAYSPGLAVRLSHPGFLFALQSAHNQVVQEPLHGNTTGRVKGLSSASDYPNHKDLRILFLQNAIPRNKPVFLPNALLLGSV